MATDAYSSKVKKGSIPTSKKPAKKSAPAPTKVAATKNYSKPAPVEEDEYYEEVVYRCRFVYGCYYGCLLLQSGK